MISDPWAWTGTFSRTDQPSRHGLCPDCHGTGTVDAPGCNCGSPSGVYSDHDPWCGLEPCPRGCPVVPLAQRGAPA